MLLQVQMQVKLILSVSEKKHSKQVILRRQEVSQVDTVLYEIQVPSLPFLVVSYGYKTPYNSISLITLA